MSVKTGVSPMIVQKNGGVNGMKKQNGAIFLNSVQVNFSFDQFGALCARQKLFRFAKLSKVRMQHLIFHFCSQIREHQVFKTQLFFLFEINMDKSYHRLQSHLPRHRLPFLMHLFN